MFSKRQPSGPMLSISRNVHLCVCVFVCLSVCSLLRYRLTIFLHPLAKVGCPKFLEIRNPWGKVVKEVVSDFNTFVWNWSKISMLKKFFFVVADFALQNMLETTLSNV